MAPSPCVKEPTSTTWQRFPKPSIMLPHWPLAHTLVESTTLSPQRPKMTPYNSAMIFRATACSNHIIPELPLRLPRVQQTRPQASRGRPSQIWSCCSRTEPHDQHRCCQPSTWTAHFFCQTVVNHFFYNSCLWGFFVWYCQILLHEMKIVINPVHFQKLFFFSNFFN